MHSRRIPATRRKSAVVIYRAWRRHLGHRQAYWLTVCRYGWPDMASLAWQFLSPVNRRIVTQP